jgi:hypothetical protein
MVPTIISAYQLLRQEDHEFETSLGYTYIMRSGLKQQQQQRYSFCVTIVSAE